MRDFEIVLKAAADPTRARILKMLETGGLCGCQIQAVLGLAPSTVSAHLAILKAAGLVLDRRAGKWIEYSLVRGAKNPYVASILSLLRGSLDEDSSVRADCKRLSRIRRIPLAELCDIGPRDAPRIAPRAHRRREGEHVR